MTKAGQNFVCTCCYNTFPENMARRDEQFTPVCPTCEKELAYAAHYLIEAGISRPLRTGDIRVAIANNPLSKNRFSNL